MSVDPTKVTIPTEEDTGKTPVVAGDTSTTQSATPPAQPPTKSAPVASGQIPSPGRIVHYVLPDGNYPGEHRPAIIVKVWNDKDGNPQPDSLVNLQVFTDSVNDFITAHPGGSGIMWRTSVHNDEDEKALGTFHWPERV